MHRWYDKRLYSAPGQPSMRGRDLKLLRTLLQNEKDGYPWLEVKLYPPRERMLLNMDVITVSPHVDTGRHAYRITLRGRVLIEAYLATPFRRNDNVCPKCGKAPLGRFPAGRRKSYCDDCLREYNRAERTRMRTQAHTDKPCRTCGVNPRRVTANGYQYDECDDCLKVRHKYNHRRTMKRLMALVESGNVPLCRRCRQRPVAVYPNSVDAFCHECSARRQRLRAFSRKMSSIRIIATRKRGSDAAD